jgi:prepilin-type N-terminal cleavage/methylation domain-containing protein
MLKCRWRLSQGFTLLEVSVVLAISVSIAIAVMRQQSAELSHERARWQANALLQVSEGVRRYMERHRVALLSANPTIAGVADALSPTIAELISLGALPAGQSENDLFGGQYFVALSQKPERCIITCTYLSGLVGMSGEIKDEQGEIRPALLTSAMYVIGTRAGASYQDSNEFMGLHDGWRLPNPAKRQGNLAIRVDINQALSLQSAPSTSPWVRVGDRVNNHAVGDIKYSVKVADHAGWLLMDGRAIAALSGLSIAQKNTLTALGFSTTLPDATNKVLLQDTTPPSLPALPSTITDYNQLSLQVNHLPSITYTGTAAAGGKHQHQVNYLTIASSATGGAFTETLMAPLMSDDGAHVHQVSLSTGGSGLPVSYENPYLSLNAFVFVGE